MSFCYGEPNFHCDFRAVLRRFPLSTRARAREILSGRPLLSVAQVCMFERAHWLVERGGTFARATAPAFRPSLRARARTSAHTRVCMARHMTRTPLPALPALRVFASVVSEQATPTRIPREHFWGTSTLTTALHTSIDQALFALSIDFDLCPPIFHLVATFLRQLRSGGRLALVFRAF